MVIEIPAMVAIVTLRQRAYRHRHRSTRTSAEREVRFLSSTGRLWYAPRTCRKTVDLAAEVAAHLRDFSKECRSG